MSKDILTDSRFAVNPVDLEMRRSTFNRPFGHKTTFDAGKLIPIYCDEVLPGDTRSIDVSQVTRMTTPILPVMDNAYLDIAAYFVPMRLVWDHTKEFFGENTSTYWTPQVEYTVPQVTAPTGGWAEGTIADYLGIPTKVSGLSVNALPFRSVALVYNEWYRDQNVQSPLYVNKDDTTIAGSNGNSYVTDLQKGGMPVPVAKFHDYFTSCLPAPQKGPSVLLPLGDSAPVSVYGNGKTLGLTNGSGNYGITFFQSYSRIQPNSNALDKNVGTTGYTDGQNTPSNGQAMGLSTNANLSGITGTADLSSATAATINQLREAFQIQRLYEKDARGGTRYIELIKSHFGVTGSDARLQRPEFLGGKRVPISMDQVLQTSSTDTTSPQGNVAAYSLTGSYDNLFNKSFEEHGYLLVFVYVRTDNTYQQGLERMWSRKRRFDFYWPTLANLGEQAVLNKEIYATGTSQDDEVFGYQEAWADYRYKPSRVSGKMRSNATGTLDAYHYASSFSSLPTLSSTFINAGKENVQRTLAVQDEPQFIIDFAAFDKATRVMPMYSIPGLIDHN